MQQHGNVPKAADPDKTPAEAPRARDLQLAELLERVRQLPPMTAEERIEQAISFAYGNLALSTRHRLPRASVAAIAWRKSWREQAAETDRLRAQVETLKELLWSLQSP